MRRSPFVVRADWGAAAPNGRVSPMKSLEGFVIHHSAMATTGDSASQVRSIQRFHQDDRRWIDIGYNYLIDAEGTAFEGRGETEGRPIRAAHSPGFNSTRLGICLLGNFENQAPPAAQVDGLVQLCQFLMVRWWLDPCVLVGHRDVRATKCPGQSLFDLLPDVIERIGGSFEMELPEPDKA